MELDLPGSDWSKPIVMLGDNDQATRWAVHGMVTTANKSVRMNYQALLEGQVLVVWCSGRPGGQDFDPENDHSRAMLDAKQAEYPRRKDVALATCRV